MDGFQWRVVDNPAEYVACDYQGVVMIIHIILFYRSVRRWRKRFETVVVQLPGRFIHAEPLEL